MLPTLDTLKCAAESNALVLAVRLVQTVALKDAEVLLNTPLVAVRLVQLSLLKTPKCC
jgi:hypothetical protein